MVAKNFPAPMKVHEFATYKFTSITLETKLFNEIRELALADNRSIANMVDILIRRGLKSKDVSK